MRGRDNYSENSLVDSAKFFYENRLLNEKMNSIICELDLPFFDESSGTKSLSVQLRRILPILEESFTLS